jgi:hypothetical protein
MVADAQYPGVKEEPVGKAMVELTSRLFPTLPIAVSWLVYWRTWTQVIRVLTLTGTGDR